MANLFDSVRHISAIDAAERAGIPMVRRGGSYWACCPLHGEKTPSMKFYKGDRGWACFGCGKGGDAVKLYEEMYRVEPVEAARMLAAAFGIVVDDSLPPGPLPKPKRGDRLRDRAAELLFNRVWGEVCDQKWGAWAVLKRLHAEGAADWDNPIFMAALMAYSCAEERLAAMDVWDIDDKRALLAEGGGPSDGGGGERST